MQQESFLDGIAADDPRALRAIAPQTLDRAAVNIISHRTQSERDVARASYELAVSLAGRRDQRTNERVTITLNPHPELIEGIQYFSIVVRNSFRTTLPLGGDSSIFLATRDPDRYAHARTDARYIDPWFFDDPHAPISAEAFTLTACRIDGIARPIATDRDNDSIWYTIPAKRGEKHTRTRDVAFEYRAIVPAQAHQLWYDITSPSRDLTITINHENLPIQRLTSRPTFFGAQPSVTHTNTQDSAPAAVTARGWIYPGSSLSIVWTLPIGTGPADHRVIGTP